MKKITSVLPEKPSQFAIGADRWDRLWYEQTLEGVERLAEIVEHLGDVHPAAPDAMADLASILSKGAPALVEPERLRADRAVNRLIAEQVLDSDGVRDVRRFSVGSQAQTALGCITFAPHLEALYADERVQEAQEKAEAAQAADDRLEELLGQQQGEGPEDEPTDEPGDQPGEGEGPSDEEIADAVAAATRAHGELDEALDQVAAKVGQVCRKAAAEASDKAQEVGEAVGTWAGTSEGEWSRMDPQEFLDRADTLTTPHFRDVARILGKMQNLRFGAHREKVDGLPTEVWSVELGNDLGRLLPTEKLGLVDDDFADDFYRRYANRQLLQYRLHSIERKAQGGIILIEDSSGSMEGEEHRWAKSLGLALGSIARDEDRSFHALEFGYRNQHKHHPFPDRKSWTAKAMMGYAGSFLNGAGTDFETPLDWAIDLLSEEFEATGRVSGDIVFVTDGEASVSQAWLDHFNTEKARLGFKVYALMVGRWAGSRGVTGFADFLGTVTNFTDGTDVREVFKAVA